MDGLDIFSHFFIDAKLDPAAVEREIFAVNNEYQIDLQKNEWRFMELLKKLSNKENPYHRFNIGNYKTLKTIPESMNLSVYDELRTFYETHYSSEKITVCVVSNETLDQLEALVTEKFSLVPRRSALENNTNATSTPGFEENLHETWNFLNINLKNSKNSLKKGNENRSTSNTKKDSVEEKHWNFLKLRNENNFKRSKTQKNQKDIPSAFTPEDLGKFVWYKTIGNNQELSVVFVMNFTIMEDPFTRSWDYLTELISNDFQSGFKNYLMNKGLINGIDAGYQTGSDFFMYIIKFDLTNDGFNRMLDLINNLFGLLGFISNQGISQTIYNEKSLISYINFLYSQKEDLDSEMTDLLQRMGQDIKNLYVSGQVYMKFDESVMRYWLSKLQPNNALFVIGSTDFQFNDNIEKIAFKRKQPKFKQNNNSLENQWEVYDDFMKEIYEDVASYRLKTGDRREDVSRSSQNETKLMKRFKKTIEEQKKSKGLFTFRSENILCRKHEKGRVFSGSIERDANDSNTFITWLYTKKLNKFDEQMKIYYRVEPVDQAQLLQFSSYISDYSGILPPDIKIYESNPYIPNDLSLLDNQCVASNSLTKGQAFQQRLLVISNFTDPIDTLIKNHLKSANDSKINSTCFEGELTKDHEFGFPDVLLKNDSVEAWIKTSREFNLPQVQLSMLFHYPNCGFESFMLELFIGKLKMVLDGHLVDAKILGYNIDINKDSVGMNVRFEGFHDKLEDLVKLFNDNLQNLTIEESEFEGIKMLYLLTDAMGSTMDSIGPQEEVIQQAELILRRALLGPDNNSYSYYLRNVDYSYFQKSVATFKKESKLKILFFGNVLQNDAQKLLSLLDNSFSFLDDNATTLNLSCVPNGYESLLKVPNDVGLVYRMKNLNNDDSNHAIINYYQYGVYDKLAELKIKAFSQTFNLKAFDFLRTVNQLGYVVLTQPIFLNKVLGMGVFIQGSKKNPFEMDGLIEDFLMFFENYLYDISDSDIKQELENINYDVFERRNKGFYDKSDAYWSEIYEGNYNFEKKDVKNMLDGLKKSDILDFYEKLMKSEQKKLSIQVWGNNETILNNTLSKDRNFAGKGQKLIDGFNNLEQYSITDNKLKFYDKN